MIVSFVNRLNYPPRYDDPRSNQFDTMSRKERKVVIEIFRGHWFYEIKCPSRDVAFGIEYPVEKYFTRSVRKRQMLLFYVNVFLSVMHVT